MMAMINFNSKFESTFFLNYFLLVIRTFLLQFVVQVLHLFLHVGNLCFEFLVLALEMFHVGV